jgi:hypothetical protein
VIVVGVRNLKSPKVAHLQILTARADHPPTHGPVVK